MLTAWYVDNGTGGTGIVGNDTTSAGTSINTPFRSINYAAQRALAGDTVFVRAGEYREEVRPLNNGTAGAPIVYTPYNGESVSIRGTSKIGTSWTQVPGSATFYTNWPGQYTSAVNNSDQVFVDGQMVHLARWPDLATSDLSRPQANQATVDSIVSNTSTGLRAWVGGYLINTIVFTDAVFTDTSNVWVGAKIWMNNGGTQNAGADEMHDGNGVTGVVTAVDGTTGTITVDIPASTAIGTAQPVNFQVGRGSRYYFFDPTTLPSGRLTYDAQWWRDRRGTTDTSDDRLYLRAANDVNPTGLSVEVKQRDWAFNFDTGIGSTDNGRRYITVNNFNIFGASITTDHLAGNGSQSADGGNLRGVTIANASNIILDGLDMKYVSHFTNQAGDLQAQWAQSSGVILSGSDNVFRNGEIAWSAGSGIIVLGQRNKVLNSKVHDTNYNVTEGGAIGMGSTRKGGGASLDAEIAYNEVYNTGVDGIQFDGLRNSTGSKSDIRARIHHNVVHNTVLQSADSGAIKMVGADGRWVRIDHNIIYNTGGTPTASQYLFYGIYLDYTATTTGGYVIDHNVVFNTPIGININRTYNIEVYNNTLLQPAIIGRHSIGNDAGGTMDGVVIRNNLANRSGRGLSGTGLNSVLSNNVFNAAETATWFVDPLNAALPSRNYSLVSNATTTGTSGAIDRGVSVSPFDDPLIGTSDLGAYEFGTARWSAGVVSTTPPAAPTALAGTAIATNRILLSWSDNAVNEIGYEIERSANGSTGWTVVCSASENAVSFTDTGLSPTTQYFYRVRATNSAGVSAFSNVGNATTLTGNIIGTVFNDLDGDGIRDAGEPGLSGRNVYVDANGNSVYDASASATLNSGNVNLAIPDNNPTGVTSTLTASGLVGTVSNVTVTLNITHTWDSDLNVFLIGPDGTQITLFSNVGGSSNNFTNTTLSDAGTSSITAGSAPFTGIFRPLQALSGFAGRLSNGAWRLKVVDIANTDIGTLSNWSLSLTTNGEATVTTNGNGDYTFGNLSNGSYSVRTVTPSPWQQTAPTGAYAVAVTTGSTFIGNFASFNPSVAPTGITLATVSDTGINNSDRVTNLSNGLQFTVTGTIAGGTVYVYNGQTLLGFAPAVNTSTVVTTTTALVDGLRNFTARQTDSGKSLSAETGSIGVTIDTLAPRVKGVWFGSSLWSTAFNTALGSTRGYDVPAGGGQLTTLPWTNLNRISVAFDENVGITQARMTLIGINVPTYSTSGFSYDSTNFVATWTLASSLTSDKLRLNVSEATTDTAGNALDGEWTDSSGSFSSGSGNGVAGGAFRFRVNVLPGDANRSGGVNSNDSNVVRSAWGTVAGGGGLYTLFRDVNGSGSINSNDSNLVRTRWGNLLPGGEPV